MPTIRIRRPLQRWRDDYIVEITPEEMDQLGAEEGTPVIAVVSTVDDEALDDTQAG